MVGCVAGDRALLYYACHPPYMYARSSLACTAVISISNMTRDTWREEMARSVLTQNCWCIVEVRKNTACIGSDTCCPSRSTRIVVESDRPSNVVRRVHPQDRSRMAPARHTIQCLAGASEAGCSRRKREIVIYLNPGKTCSCQRVSSIAAARSSSSSPVESYCHLAFAA